MGQVDLWQMAKAGHPSQGGTSGRSQPSIAIYAELSVQSLVKYPAWIDLGTYLAYKLDLTARGQQPLRSRPVSMKPRRFFVEGEPLKPGERLVAGKRAHHLTRVLRLGVGDSVVLFDGSGREFPAEILEVGRQRIRVKVSSGKRIDRESPLNLMLALGLSKPSIMDLIVQKVTELGVNEIVPVQTERTQGWSAGTKDLARIKRWGRIAQEAARQSGRNVVPRIWPPTDYTSLLKQTDNKDVKLICWEGEKKENLRQALKGKRKAHQACVLVGPEGGFSEKEAKEAASAGFQSVSLGRRVLRTETAVIVVIGLIQYKFGDLGL